MSKHYRNLEKNIDKKSVRCLNENTHFPVQNLFLEHGELQSLDDEQLIIHIPFTEMVSLWSINIVSTPANYASPKIIHLYKNKPNMTFLDVDSHIPTQTIELQEEELLEERHCLLKFTSFQKISHLTIFIEDNEGCEITSVNKLSIFGKTLKGMNMKDLKKCGG